MAKTKKAATTRVFETPELAAMHVEALDLGKSKYKEADAALEAIVSQACTKCKTCGQLVAGQEIQLGDETGIPRELRGKRFRLVDKFASRLSIGVGLSARRFELEEVNTPTGS